MPPVVPTPGPSSPLAPRPLEPTSASSLPHSNFSGQTILVIFNPRAKQGRFAAEAPALRQSLEEMGFRVVFMETVPDPAERSTRIREVARGIFSEPGRGPIYVFPVGGDGIVDEGVRETVQGMTGRLSQIPSQSPINEVVQQRIRAVVMAQVGSLSDIAYQLGAPPRNYILQSVVNGIARRPPPLFFSRVPQFIEQARTIPYPLPTVESEVAPGRSIFHSVGWGTSGFLFEHGERRMMENPQRVWNQKPWVFFRLLPEAIWRYGLRGVGVTIEHHGQTQSFRVGDLLGSSNRIISAVGGIPGRWGEFQLMAIPNGPWGVVVMGESIFRGIATLVGHKFGFHAVGADAALWTLPRERLITLRPGERAQIRFFDPRTRQPIAVPWMLNGDAVSTSTPQAEIYVPPVTVPMGVGKGSLALRLFQQEDLRRALALSRGETHDVPPLRRLPGPSFTSGSSGAGGRGSSPFYPGSNLRSLMLNYDLEPSRLPLLVARAHGVNAPADLSRLQSHPSSWEDVERWLRSEEGMRQVQADRSLLGDTFRNRLETHGFGLALGLGTLVLSNHLMQGIGVDPRRDPVLHFSGVALSSHAMNQVGNAWAGVFINRARGLPYDWAMAESRAVGRMMASRMVYESNPTLLRALGHSTLRSPGWQAGPGSMILQGGRNLVGVPLRMAAGMGPGLACSRITETVLSRYTSLGEGTLHTVGTVAFFAPSIYHLAAGNRGLGVLESSTFRWGGRLFAAGFVADLGLMGIQSAVYGEGASYERWVNHRASALREAEEGDAGIISLSGIAHLVAPEIASWWDTVDVLGFGRNQYYRRVLEADRARIEARFGTPPPPSSH